MAQALSLDTIVEDSFDNSHEYLTLRPPCYGIVLSGTDAFYSYVFDSDKAYRLSVSPVDGLDLMVMVYQDCVQTNDCVQLMDDHAASSEEQLMLENLDGEHIIQVMSKGDLPFAEGNDFIISLEVVEVDGDLDDDLDDVDSETADGDLDDDLDTEIADADTENSDTADSDNAETENSDTDPERKEDDLQDKDAEEVIEPDGGDSDSDYPSWWPDGDMEQDAPVDDTASNCRETGDASAVMFVWAILFVLFIARKRLKHGLLNY